MIKKKLKKIEDQVSQAKDMSAELLHDLKKLVSSTRKDLQKQVEELRSQVKELTEGSAKPALKAINKFEQRYQDQLARLQVEFDRKTEALIAAKDAIISQIEEEVSTRFPGLVKSKSPAEAKQSKTQKAAAKAKQAQPEATKAEVAPKVEATKAPEAAEVADSSPVEAPAEVKKPTAKKAPAKKAAAKKAPVKKAPAKKSSAKAPSIASINGIGPVTVKKLEEAGITSLNDIAEPSAEKKKTLEQFSKVRGFSTWQTQAQALLK